MYQYLKTQLAKETKDTTNLQVQTIMNGSMHDVVLHRDPVRPKNPNTRGIGVMETARVHVGGPAGDDGARVHP